MKIIKGSEAREATQLIKQAYLKSQWNQLFACLRLQGNDMYTIIAYVPRVAAAITQLLSSDG